MSVATLEHEFTTQQFLKDRYQFLVDPGVADYSSAVHSHLIGYLISLGTARGYATASDSPPYWGQAYSPASTGIIRPDGLWYTPIGRLTLAFEVERYKRELESTLREKAENLVLVSHQAPEPPDLLVFLYWVISGEIAPVLGPVFDAFVRPFTRDQRRVMPPRCPVMVAKCLMTRREDQYLSLRSISRVLR